MDGLEATRRIRRLPEMRQPRIFAMTASVLDSERQDCIDAGMERHIAKPIRKRQLEEVLHEVAEAAVAARQPAAAKPSPVSAPESAETDGADEKAIALLIEEVGRDGAIEVLDAMVSGAALACQVLREAWAGADLRVVKRQLHTMKANCAMVGAERLAADCSRLERRLPEFGKEGQGDRAGFGELLRSIERRYGGLADELMRQHQRLQVVGD